MGSPYIHLDVPGQNGYGGTPALQVTSGKVFLH
jgi:hypothetical protein